MTASPIFRPRSSEKPCNQGASIDDKAIGSGTGCMGDGGGPQVLGWGGCMAPLGVSTFQNPLLKRAPFPNQCKRSQT